MNQTLVQAIFSHGEAAPEKLAVALKDQQLTYGELCSRVRAFAFYLQTDYDVQKRDYVMVSAVSKPDYIVAMLAIQYLGAVTLPVDKSAKEANLLDICDVIHPKLVLTDTKLDAGKVNRVSLKALYIKSSQEKAPMTIAYTQPSMADVAEILFTTGTTGKPKGAMLTYGNILANTQNTWHGIGMLESDRILLPLPLNHSFGMRVLRTSLYIGATVILQNGFTFAKGLETNIETYSCTGLASVPASMELLYRQMQERFAEIMGRLRYIEVSAGSLPRDMRRKLLEILPHTQIHNTWGSTETGGALFLNLSEHRDKLDSIGKPLDGIDLKVVDGQGNPVEARDIDTAGRMVLRGPMQMSGYYNMPDVTAETLVDGWLYTNDIVYTDDDGYVYMLGRADDIINVGGEKVSPIEVENIAQDFDGVRECACIGVDDPDGVMGKVPVLYVVPEGARFSEEDLTRFLTEKMERYKLPHRYILIQRLPRNRMQKIDRKALHQMWQDTGDKLLMNDTIRSLFGRRSIRDFTEQPVPKAYLDVILQTGIYAPSGHNMQTWQFTVIQDQAKIRHLKEIIAETVKDKRNIHFYGFNNPQVIILISNDRRNNDGIQDSSCAAENMMLAAHSFGIGSVWINALCTICDEPEIRQLLDEYGIPHQHIVWAMLAMGYPKAEGKQLAKKQNVIHWGDEK